MLTTVINYIKDNKMINPGEKVVLGLSGGADSVCLLFVLLEYKKIADFSLKAVHINHMIRGEEAYRDEEFVVKLCSNYGIDCLVEHMDIPKISAETGLGLEEAARKERYSFFEKMDTDKIVIAHHMDDLAETVLFNLVRGSGLKGLSSLKAVNGKIIRPLLCVKRKDIIKFLDDKNIDYCIDSTNADIDYSRNRIRKTVMPELININEQAVSHIKDCSEIIAQTEEYVSEIVDEKTKNIFVDGAIDIDKLSKEPEIIQKRIIKQAIIIIANRSKDITMQHVLDIKNLMNTQSGKKVYLPYNLLAYREYEKIFIKNNRKEEIRVLKGSLDIKHIKPVNISDYPQDNYTKWIDYAKIKDGVVLRSRQQGDYIHIKNGTKKIQNLFTDLKIPANKRDEIPLVCDGNEVIWVVGYRLNEDYKVSDETKDIVQITYEEKSNGNRI